MDTNALTVIDGGLATWEDNPEAAFDRYKRQLIALKRFTQEVMVEGEDWGTIPGTHKPTLYKPGAEKLLNIFGYATEIEAVDKVEDMERGFFSYTYRAIVRSKRTGEIVAECDGNCNSHEDKYRWTWLFDNQVPAELDKTQLTKRSTRNGGFQYRIETPLDQRFSLINTLRKMSQKRAIVGAALLATRASGIFTQDIEDLAVDPKREAWDLLQKVAESLNLDHKAMREILKETGFSPARELPGKLADMIRALATAQPKVEPQAESKAEVSV